MMNHEAKRLIECLAEVMDSLETKYHKEFALVDLGMPDHIDKFVQIRLKLDVLKEIHKILRRNLAKK